MTTPVRRVCYMSLAKLSFSRAGVQIPALKRAGIEVQECVDDSPGLRKFWRLYHKHRALKGTYDILIVAYPSYLLVPFARLIARTPVIFDAGWSLYEGEVLSRGRYRSNPFGRFRIWMIDRMAARAAHAVLLETDHQVAFYEKLLRLRSGKCKRIFTGVDDSVFYPREVQKNERFTVVFRGKPMAEAGIEVALEAAELLVDEEIDFVVLSPGYKANVLPQNVTLVSEFLLIDDLLNRLAASHIALGQLAKHERLSRTIPHKAFEMTALGIAYVSADAEGIREYLTPGESMDVVQGGDAQALADMLLVLKQDPVRVQRLAASGRKAFETRATSSLLARELVTIIEELL